MRPGYDNFLNVFSHIINLARHVLGPSPVVAESSVEASGAARLTLDFDGIACVLELANGSEGAWREGLTINFERGAVTIELPAPFAEDEAQIILDQDGRICPAGARTSWAFRRQADAFVSDIADRRAPLASGADSITDIALAETVWKQRSAARLRAFDRQDAGDRPDLDRDLCELIQELRYIAAREQPARVISLARARFGAAAGPGCNEIVACAPSGRNDGTRFPEPCAPLPFPGGSSASRHAGQNRRRADCPRRARACR